MGAIVKNIIILIETIKAFVAIIFQFIFWCYTNKFVRPFTIITTVVAVFWSAGFLYYVESIDKTFDELVESNPELTETTDAIVVLTGGSERLRHALHLLRLDMAKKLFISGVNSEVKLHELFVLHGYSAAEEASLGHRVELGYYAADTTSNGQEVADWVKKNDIKSIRLVTSNYHINRAMIEIQDKLPDTKIIPHGVVPLNIRIDRWWEFKPTRDLLINEYNKYLAANLRIFLEKLGY
jgi:uncharacterized SAM-binding protein YcdF (DUF218 family)